MSEKMLRVKDWDKHYENHRTRMLKKLAWVPVHTGMDNEGYLTLTGHPNGAAHLGAWLAILQIASRCRRRGTLQRDDGTAHTARSLALISRMPAQLYEEALPRLVEIGWLETSPESGADLAVPGANPALSGAVAPESGENPALGIKPQLLNHMALSGADPALSGATPRESGANLAEVGARIEGNGIEQKGREAVVTASVEAPQKPPLKPAEKFHTDEERTQWVRDTLIGYVSDVPGWALPPPDDALCQRVMAIVGKEHLPVLGQALRELHRTGKRPANSWGWFPMVLEEWLKPKRIERAARAIPEEVPA